jgi:hypothetical protein
MDTGFSIFLDRKAGTSEICPSCKRDPSGKNCNGCNFVKIPPTSAQDFPAMAIKWASPEGILYPFKVSGRLCCNANA